MMIGPKLPNIHCCFLCFFELPSFTVFVPLDVLNHQPTPYVRWKCSLQHGHGHGFLRYLMGRWQGGGEDRGGDGVWRVNRTGFQIEVPNQWFLNWVSQYLIWVSCKF